MKRVLGQTGRARQGVASPSRSGTLHCHGWCTANTSLLLGTPPEVVPAPLGSPVWAVPGPVRVPDCPATSQPASQPVPSACLPCRVLTSSSVHSRCRHISPARGWLAGTYPLLLQLSPPTPRLTFLTPSIHQRLAARTLLHPSASKPADNSSSYQLQPSLSAPLSCQY